MMEDGAAQARLLVCIDLLEPAAASEEPRAYQRCVANSRRLLNHAREAGWEVVHCLGRDLPARAIPGLEPLASEPVYQRDGLSAFSSRGFRRRMRAWPSPDLVIIGCSLASTCLATALAAFDRGIPASLVLDAISVRSDDVIGSEPFARTAVRMAAPFVKLSNTDDFVGRRRAFQLVAVG